MSMATQAPTTAVARRDDLAAYLATKVAYMQESLPRHITPERLVRVALTAITQNPRLLECTRESLALALIEAGQLGLEPTGVMGQAYLVPYRDGKTARYVAQFQIGYRGMMDLARRSGQVRKIEARVVREGDHFEYEYGLQPRLVHRPASSPDAPLTHVYAIAWLRDADPIVEVMSRAEVEAVRRRSRAADSGPWITDYDAMARKTVVRRICKYLPLAPEAAAAIEADSRRDVGQIVRITDAGVEVEDTTDPQPTRTATVTDRLRQRATVTPAAEPIDVPEPQDVDVANEADGGGTL